MANLRQRLLDCLLDSKYLNQEQLDHILRIQKQKGKHIRQILIEEKFISEKDLMNLLSRQLYIPPLDLSRYKIDPQLLEVIPERFAKQYALIPVSKIGTTLTVAMADPLNIFALDDLKTLTGFDIDVVISLENDIYQAIARFYQAAVNEMSSAIKEGSDQKDKVKDTDIAQLLRDEDTVEVGDAVAESEKPPIVKIVDLMLVEALKKRSSDIHIEPQESDLRVRYRIDGNLCDIFALPKKNQNGVTARLKIISGLDITESRVPQDGRFTVKLPAGTIGSQEKEVDFRVSALPTTFGQKFVLRALDKSNLSVGLEDLGFSPGPLELFKEAIKKPYGMILVTGPTGSGKSTTLYSILNKLNTPERNIITVEDPVEYQVEGIGQIQVKPEIGLTFASGLRSLLRQSPDIIMIGEIRDFETADIAIKASLTGQMVLSTLHTNDAASSITRLIDMGVEPFLVGSSIIMTCAQRLCRVICPGCKETQSIPQEALKSLGPEFKPGLKFYHGKGCLRCNQTGYYGRVAIIEALMIDDKIREMVIKCVSSDEIKDYAVKNMGFNTLRDDAIKKLYDGVTTLEEVIRVTSEG